jgi:hypothetical protein
MDYGMLPMFGGQMMGGMMGGGMFGGQDDEEEKKRRGMNPLQMMSPLAMLAGHHPGMALGMISPLAGGMRALGLFK